MKSLIILSVTILFCLHFGESAVYIAPNSVDPAYPGKCVDKDDNLIMNPGDTKTIRKSCTRVTCSDNYDLDYATCGTILFPPNCHLGEVDETKDYPECCPKPVCDEDNVVNK